MTIEKINNKAIKSASKFIVMPSSLSNSLFPVVIKDIQEGFWEYVKRKSFSYQTIPPIISIKDMMGLHLLVLDVSTPPLAESIPSLLIFL